LTRMLASVRDLREAEIAVRGGADILDLKEPASGALGVPPAAVLRAVSRRYGARLPVSAAIGEPPLSWAGLSVAAQAASDAGVALLKVGLYAADPNPELPPLLQRLRGWGLRLVLVYLAEGGVPSLACLRRQAAAGAFGAMLDTREKEAPPLPRRLRPVRLRRFVAHARAAGLLCGLAGSLAEEDIPALLELRPDYLGFRGALCRGGRTGRQEAGCVSRIRARIPARGSSALPAVRSAAANML